MNSTPLVPTQQQTTMTGNVGSTPVAANDNIDRRDLHPAVWLHVREQRAAYNSDYRRLA